MHRSVCYLTHAITLLALIVPVTFSAGLRRSNPNLQVRLHISQPANPSPLSPEAGVTSRVSVASNGTQGDTDSFASGISNSGRYVLFYSGASSLVSNDTNGVLDVFVHDRQTGETRRVSVASDGSQGNDESGFSAISNDGRYVAFHSWASNLVINDTNDMRDIFVHELQSGQTERVSVATDGTQANGDSFHPSISANGRYVTFRSYATNLVSADTGGDAHIFVRDRQTGETTLVSVTSDGTPVNGGSDNPSISGDGRYVAFESWATNLVDGDTNGYADIYVHDRQTGENIWASVGLGGLPGDSESLDASISADGRYVVFWSSASNLVSGDTNEYTDIFIRDLLLGQTSLISVGPGGEQGDYVSTSPSISSNGRYVVFSSGADNLDPVCEDSPTKIYDIFLYDRQGEGIYCVSLATNGDKGNWLSGDPFVTGDGRYVAFDSAASNLVPGDTINTCDSDFDGIEDDNCWDVFVRRWNVGDKLLYLPAINR